MMQVYNLIRQPAQTYQVDRSEGIMPYGVNNAFPLELATLVQESPAASSCISILSDFIEGNGFSNPDLNNLIINSQNQTFGEIHNLVSEAYSLFEGFSLLVKYSKTGQLTEIYNVPFENVRLCEPDSKGVICKVKVNPYYGTQLYNKKFSEEFDTYNPDPKVVLSQIAKQGAKYKGQILYKAFTRPLSRFYSLPYYYSAKYWMDIDAEIGKFHAGNLDAGFFQTVLMRKIGDPNAPSMHPDDQETDSAGNKQSNGTTVAQRFNIDMQPFVGADSVTKMLIDWASTKEEATDIQSFPSLPNDAFFQTLQAITTKNILIATKIPAILANMGGETSLSDGNQMANATRVMHDRVSKTQNMLEVTYKDVLGHMAKPYNGEVKIVNTNSFETLKAIDELIWAEMTPEDRMNWIKKNTDYPISPKPVSATPAPMANFSNVLFTDYPAKARQNAKDAMRFMKENPGCGKPMGRQRTQDIIDGKPLSFAELKRIYNYLKRNREHENKIFSDSCDAVMYSGWGGSSMLDYCAEKITFINE